MVFYTWPSLNAYWKYSPWVVIIGMVGWLLTHLIWLKYTSALWCISIILLALMSTTFYANLFVYQNYNVLGWLFFPLGLYGLFTSNWLLASGVWFLISFNSVTVSIIGFILCAGVALVESNMHPLFSVIPAFIKLGTHAIPLFEKGKFWEIVQEIAGSIGLLHKNIKYKRIFIFKKIHVYFLILYFQFTMAYWLYTDKIPYLFIIAIILYILNLNILRFADFQSIYILIFSLATAYMLLSDEVCLLVSYWILVSPIPRALQLPSKEDVFDVVPQYAPFEVSSFIRKMEDFLNNVRKSDKIMLAFDDPQYEYHRIFDGYRVLLELLFYVVSLKEIHAIPDWWAIYQANVNDNRNFWGRDTDAVLKNVVCWRADYVLVYQKCDTTIDSKWEALGFKLISKFSWKGFGLEDQLDKPFGGDFPDWFLLKVPEICIKSK